ncbi:hypothetical protein RKE25_03860 [Dyella sp. BiH032]|uniref:hypothetical protein n=1 Tax=Dyella sp. BiH032 TaxID=3075430 RepID=UPI002892D92F|nr:hypothetical protein [Dyella sp. BiH032]WNL46785.1 hypothetical protein RKE25_03860 [Dyella sp. BiH032]
MRIAKLLTFAVATIAAGLAAGTATASPNCPVCQQAYLSCVNKDPNNSANIAACMTQFSLCLSYCGEPATAAAQRESWLDARKYRPDLSTTSIATAHPTRLAPLAP